MATTHIVKQGEHLSGIAAQYGFASHLSIWNHPQNAELKKKREDPQILLPRDEVYIPDKEIKYCSKPTEKRHRFVADMEPLVLRVKLEKGFDQPLADTNCDTLLGADRRELRTDGGGEIKEKIPKDLEKTTLLIHDTTEVAGKQIPYVHEVSLLVGHLDPLDTLTGQLARLANLGYYRGAFDKVDEQEHLSAVEEFQCEHGLTVDGKSGPQTLAKLKQVYGC